MQSGAGLQRLRTGGLPQDKTYRVTRCRETIRVWTSLWNLFVNLTEYKIIPAAMHRSLWPEANGLANARGPSHY